MKRLHGFLALSLMLAACLVWISPVELSFRWGESPDEVASLRLSETVARADWTNDERQAIADVETSSENSQKINWS